MQKQDEARSSERRSEIGEVRRAEWRQQRSDISSDGGSTQQSPIVTEGGKVERQVGAIINRSPERRDALLGCSQCLGRSRTDRTTRSSISNHTIPRAH